MQRSAVIFQPSPASYGFVWSDDGPEEVAAVSEGRVPHGQSMIDAVDQVNIWSVSSTGVLKSLSGLQHMDLMRGVATADSAAQLKAAYWLHVAARSFDRSVFGTSPRDRLESKADGLAERGEAEVTQEGSSSRKTAITGIYADAANALKNEMEAAGGGNPVQKQIYDILAKGASASNVQTAIARQDAQVRAVKEDAEAREEAERKANEKPCEETLMGKIPGYCTAQTAYKVVVFGTAGLLLIGAAAWTYKQVRS